MSDKTHGGVLAGPGVMLLSAAIFAYFGFGLTWITTGNNGQFLVYVAILEWTLKVSTIAFLLSAAITVASPLLGNILFSLLGLLGALAFVVILILDWRDPQHTALSPILLIIFAGWNGYNSWTGLRDVLSERAVKAPDQSTFAPPDSGG
jgi:hypothetical protein